MQNPNAIKAVSLAVFRPRAFIKYAIAHDCAKIKEAYDGRDLTPQEIENTRNLSAKRLCSLRSSLGRAWLLTEVAVACGIVFGFILQSSVGAASSRTVLLLQLIGASIILAATLALLGWDIQSMEGDTLPERVNQWLFRFQYWVGTFLFVLSVVWSA
ncbi:MAG: hypothetical protein OEZ39_12060 [Gammaproteobacteria bacterium]|nr:hypothetical protein [Gammaproteobacteria bacterium]MDH5652578.1 hypothetical protein [Gammaproteobacteria bacterium]